MLEWSGNAVLGHTSNEFKSGDFLSKIDSSGMLDVESIGLTLGNAGEEIIVCVVVKANVVSNDLCVGDSNIMNRSVDNEVVEGSIDISLNIKVKFHSHLWGSGSSISAHNCKISVESTLWDVSNLETILCAHLDRLTIFLNEANIKGHLEVLAVVIFKFVEDLNKLILEIFTCGDIKFFAVKCEKSRVYHALMNENLVELFVFSVSHWLNGVDIDGLDQSGGINKSTVKPNLNEVSLGAKAWCSWGS